jgi:hypothetical protein
MVVRVTNNYGIRRMIGFINSSVTHAHLITMKYKQYQRYSHRYNPPLLTH